MSSAKVPHERAPWHWGCPASGVDANRPCCRGRPPHARPLQGTGTRGAADAGEAQAGGPGAGGPCRRAAGALCAGRGVQPRGSTGWTRGRGAEGMAVQAEQTARADVSVCHLPSVEVASSWVLLRRWPRWALLFPTWPRWCCRRQKPVAGWPRSDPDHQPCWGVPGTAPPACAQGSPCSARCPVPPAEVTRPGQRLVVADVDGSRSWGWHLVPRAGPGAWGCPGWLRCRAAVGEGREHGVGPRQHAAGLSQVLRGGALSVMKN